MAARLEAEHAIGDGVALVVVEEEPGVQALRARRDAAAVEAALARLKAAAAGDENLMGPILEATRAYVTMGEMCDGLREVWGVWRETPVF